MPIRKIIKSIAGKPNIDEVPIGYSIVDFKRIDGGYEVLIRMLEV